MRSLVLNVLLLTSSAFVVLEWVRPPSRPIPARSDEIGWVVSSLWVSRSTQNWYPDPSLSVSEQVEQARAALGDARFWARKMYERYEGPLDEVACWAIVTSASAKTVSARVLDHLPINEEWRFLVRHGAKQYVCRVTRWDGRRLEGVVLESEDVFDGAQADNGVILYRPLHLRPAVRARPGDPHAELDALARELGRMSAGIDSTRPHGPRGPKIVGRVLESMQATDMMLVVIDAGRDEGVDVGTEFRMSRRSKFVGFAKVTRVFASTAVAEFDSEFPGTAAPPRAGDRAFTR